MNPLPSRRSFLQAVGLSAAAFGFHGSVYGQEKNLPKEGVIQGFEQAEDDPNTSKDWQPVSDRKVRMGIVGYGYCRFGAAFGFQDHPNVEVVAVSDLFADRCDGLAKACRCAKTYPSLEELVKDETIEAVFVATDAPSHARHCIDVMKHGKHVCTAVPAVYGSVEDADRLFEAVKSTGRKYMMFETSAFHADCHAMRKLYNAGFFGKLVYSEGEYFHYAVSVIPSYKDWRVGVPPQWYPTHSNAYYTCVTGGGFTEVSCMGMPSVIEALQPQNNRYKNPFGTEIALFRTTEGGMARMAVSWDTPGRSGEMGRIRGQKGTFYNKYDGLEKRLPKVTRPPLPPGVAAGGHEGSHGHLTEEFIRSILEDRTPLIDIAWALNLTVPGVVAHQSALNDGELMKVPVYSLG
ncbi:MAG TPA: gfo/Idh/MocA family oxidoreductase [Planctomycetaceae bacterium]|nr:gfo/Idh/MocA family oxidoreductase [Planctomycetaceae bacterium]